MAQTPPLSMSQTSPSLPAPVIPDLVQRYLDGETILSLAAEHSTSYRTIYRWMLAETGEQYADLITHALVNRIADADQQMDSARDTCQLARAREQAKFARMDFERRRPKLYGPKQEVSVDEKITVIVQRHQPPQDIVIDVRSTQDKDEKVKEINGLNV